MNKQTPAATRDRARAFSEQVHVDALLNQWLRETHAVPHGDHLVLEELVSSGRELHAEVLHRSPTGVHRFAGLRARYPVGPLPGGEQRVGDDPVGALELAELLGREAAYRGGGRTDWDGAAAAGAFLAAVADSVRGLEEAVLDGAVPAAARGTFDPTVPGAAGIVAPGRASVRWVAEVAADGGDGGIAGLPAPPPGHRLVPYLGRPAHGATVVETTEGHLHEDGRTVDLDDGPVLVFDEAPADEPEPGAAALTVDGVTVLRTTALLPAPDGGRCRVLTPGPGPLRSLGSLLTRRPDGPVAAIPDPARWFAGYLERLLVPLLRIWAEHGLALAPDPDATLVELDDDGHVRRIRCDDRLRCDDADTCPETVADRMTHFLLRDHLLVVVGLLGSVAGADEQELLRVLTERVDAAAAEFPDGPVAGLLSAWRSESTLPLRTVRLGGLLNREHVFARPGRPAVYQRALHPLARAGSAPDPVRLGPPPVPELSQGWDLRMVLPDDSDAIALVHDWMHRPHVAEGWRQAWTLEHWEREIREQHAGTWVRPFLVTLDGQDVAYMEVYRNAGHPMAACYRVRPTDVGFHMAIGEPAGINRGTAATLFPMIIRAILAAEPSCERVVGEPNVRNGAMRRSMIKTKWTITREIALAHKNAMLVVHERGGELAD